MLLPLMIHLTEDFVGNIDSTVLVIATIALVVVTLLLPKKVWVQMRQKKLFIQ
jgi:hypothetical protein